MLWHAKITRGSKDRSRGTERLRGRSGGAEGYGRYFLQQERYFLQKKVAWELYEHVRICGGNCAVGLVPKRRSTSEERDKIQKIEAEVRKDTEDPKH